MMDAGMAPHQVGIAQQLTKLGWSPGLNLQVRVHEGAGHAFADTAVQMDAILTWLLA
jgi:NaMN:DMB phosphoribosyltransferase